VPLVRSFFHFEYEVLKKKRDLNGNYLALDVVIDKQKLTLLSLYGPNMDNPDFYGPVSNKCCNFWILENETHLFFFQYYQGLDS
jgi:hypothetical protein